MSELLMLKAKQLLHPVWKQELAHQNINSNNLRRKNAVDTQDSYFEGV